MQLIPRLRMVILDNPAELWHDREVRSLFTTLVSLKLKGYGAEYPQGVIAVDGTDFYGTHLVVCEESPDGKLNPIVGYRSISLQRCKERGLVFPATSLVEQSRNETFIKAIAGIIDDCESSRRDISYDSSWTMHKSARQDKELSKLMRNLITSIAVHYHSDAAVPEWLTGGVLRFKTEQYFQWLGGKAVTGEFANNTLAGEIIQIVHVPSFSKDAMTTASAHSQYWEQMILFAKDDHPIRKAALKPQAA